MTLKLKITLSLLFLFSIILVLGGLGAFYLHRLSQDSQAILKDNYISLELISNMQKALSTSDDPDALADFELNLKKQEANVTEENELQATRVLRREFDRLRKGVDRAAEMNRIRQQLFTIDDLNRQAIGRKSKTAQQTADDALVWLGFFGTLCFLIVFSFVINIPSYIANPLRELTQGIRQVTSRNFEERLHVRSHDEFGELARAFNLMAQKLDEYEHSNLAKVLFEKKRIDTLIELMPDGIIGLDEKRRILFINPVAGRLLGGNSEALIGQYAPDVATANDLLRVLIQDIMTDPTDNRPAPIPIRSDPKGNLLNLYDPGLNGAGKESYFTKQIHSVEVTPTGETQPVHAGYVIVLQNITSFKELDLAKTNFIATVSHELKTPLSSIKLSLKLLDDKRVGELNTEQKQLVGNVRDDADRLLTLTGELLTMAQVESGQIQLKIEAVKPTDIITYATNALRTQASQKQVHFVLDIPDQLPAVKADPDKASWVLINFLSNAVRHSPPEKPVDISVRFVDHAIDFTVRDYGPGLRPEHQERVFDRYFRVPGPGDQVSGTGLGLAISREFIESMGGTVGLRNELPSGAAFWFRLPVN